MATTKYDPCALPAGELRHNITFLESFVQPDAVSGNSLTWNPVGTFRAKVEPYRASDLIRSGQTATETYITITMRYVPGIVSDMRAQLETGGTYTIQGIENILERNRVLRLTCLGIGSTND